jgi:hypothetical protein
MSRKRENRPKYYELKTWIEVGRHPPDGDERPVEPEDCEHLWDRQDGIDGRKFRDCDCCGSIEELILVKVLGRVITAPSKPSK